MSFSPIWQGWLATNLARADYRTAVDYGRKRGLIEEINKTVGRIARERKLIEELEGREISHPDGPVVAEELTPAHPTDG